MEYSVDFENMVKSHQDKFIGYGNLNAKILIVVPKIDDERLDIYNGKNAKQWLDNIENHTDFDNVEDFFVDGKQIGNESTFNPLYPFKGQRDVLRKSKDGTIICNDGTSLSWHRYQDLFSDLQWDVTDRIDFFKYTFYTIYDEELLKHSYFQEFRIVQYAYPSKKHFLQNDPGNLFNMTCDYHNESIRKANKKLLAFTRHNSGKNEFAKMFVTLPYERVSEDARKKNKDYLRFFFYDYLYDDFKQTNVSIIKQIIDLLASEKISGNVIKRNRYEQIMNTIQVNIVLDLKWSDIWVYAFRNLNKDKMFYSSASSPRSSIITALPLVLATTSPEIVREIVLYIMKIDKEYWSLLYIVLNRLQPVRGGTWILIPKATYNELMNIFEEIDSKETRTMLKGKLIWLKYEQRSWGLDY
jgi:hypothetical protein